jgi:hypothetical protein
MSSQQGMRREGLQQSCTSPSRTSDVPCGCKSARDGAALPQPFILGHHQWPTPFSLLLLDARRGAAHGWGSVACNC